MLLSDAIVLRTSPYSESTLIVWLLTREDGVARVVAKGARRLKGHTAATFDLYSVVRAKLRLAKGDALGSVSSVELKTAFSFLRTDLKRLALASTAMEILGAVAQASPPDPFYFEDALGFLGRLETSTAPGSLAAGLMLRLLFHAGHPPRMADELASGELPERLAYDFAEGEIKAATGAIAVAGGRHFALPRALVERLRPWLERPPPLGEGFAIPSSEGPTLLRWLARVWEDHLNQPIRSLAFLEKMAFGEN